MRIIMGDGSVVYTDYIRYEPRTMQFESDGGIILDLANVMSIMDVGVDVEEVAS